MLGCRCHSGLRLGRLMRRWLLLLHPFDEALRPHVGPVLVDVVQTGGATRRLEGDSPARGDLLEGRPQRILAFVVDQHVVGGVFVFERIHVLLLLVLASFERRSRARLSRLPISAAEEASIMSSCAQSIRWISTRPVT